MNLPNYQKHNFGGITAGILNLIFQSIEKLSVLFLFRKYCGFTQYYLYSVLFKILTYLINLEVSLAY